METKQNRVKTFRVELPETQVNVYRKGMTVDFEGHPRAVVTRVKGNTVWAIPAPAAAPETSAADNVMTWAERGLAVYRIIRYGRV